MPLLSVKLIQMLGVSVAAIVCDFCPFHVAVVVSEQVSRSETIKKKLAVTAILFELYTFSFMGLQIFGK